jgi:hypothetical protein
MEEGWLYFAVVLVLFSRRMEVWACGEFLITQYRRDMGGGSRGRVFLARDAPTPPQHRGNYLEMRTSMCGKNVQQCGAARQHAGVNDKPGYGFGT